VSLAGRTLYRRPLWQALVGVFLPPPAIT
jgi:hypothetical protein